MRTYTSVHVLEISSVLRYMCMYGNVQVEYMIVL